MALLRAFTEAANLEPVVVISDPDGDGIVQINRIVHGDEGPSDRWHIRSLYAFDDVLMDRVNTPGQ
jgi:hypothetical protein